MAHFSRKQQWDNACGAACLLCAALEAGKTSFPAIPPWDEAQTLQNTNASETLLYYISSGLYAKAKPFAETDNRAGYSMPSSLIEAAQHVGFRNATIYTRKTLSLFLLKIFYGDEIQKCRAMHGVTVEEGKAPSMATLDTLDVKAYKLVVVEPGFPGLHYVLHRPDGTYMDPAKGADLDKMPLLYNRTGVSIIIS